MKYVCPTLQGPGSSGMWLSAKARPGATISDTQTKAAANNVEYLIIEVLPSLVSGRANETLRPRRLQPYTPASRPVKKIAPQSRGSAQTPVSTPSGPAGGARGWDQVRR